ncbi:MAG TPA: molybdopterin-dependent oxidoreductase, partial [bacterium]|nr:molybdopterin-dependent oxidoreductase [bacterium]
LYSMGITQHTSGTNNVMSVANLAMLTGNIGKPGTGVNPLRGQNNVQGSCDMGALPNVFSGYQQVSNPDARKKFSAAWKAELPESSGLTATEMMRAAIKGDIKAMYIMGENPMVSDPDTGHVRKALEKLDLLIVQDIFITETAKLADVVLPAVCFAEKDGTFTNTERRVQRVRAAVAAPGDSKQDWRIIGELAMRFGYRMDYESPERIMEEIASLTPSYGGVDYERIDREAVHWPCPSKSHPGTPILHIGAFTRGKGKFAAVEFSGPDEVPDADYPMTLITGRILYHYHTGTMTRRSRPLDEHVPQAFFQINPEDARSLNIADGQFCDVTSRRGAISIAAAISDAVPEGSIFIPFHFAEAAANALTNSALDPIAKIPEL